MTTKPTRKIATARMRPQRSDNFPPIKPPTSVAADHREAEEQTDRLFRHPAVDQERPRELAGGLEAGRGHERKGEPEPGRPPAQRGLQVLTEIGQAMPDAGRLRRFPDENHADERDPDARDQAPR